jgi:hypothetical protein
MLIISPILFIKAEAQALLLLGLISLRLFFFSVRYYPEKKEEQRRSQKETEKAKLLTT